MIDVEITAKRPVISIDLSGGGQKEIDVDVGPGHSGAVYPVYDGPTTIKPEAYEMQILQTEKKTLLENIITLPIPYYETSNPQGGMTVYIGE